MVEKVPRQKGLRCSGVGSGVQFAVIWMLWSVDIFRTIVSFASEKPITTQFASFNLCSTMLLPVGREASLRLTAASLPGNPQNCLNSLVIRDPSTLSKRETEAKPPSTDVKNPRDDGVLVHLVCDMETHCV